MNAIDTGPRDMLTQRQACQLAETLSKYSLATIEADRSLENAYLDVVEWVEAHPYPGAAAQIITRYWHDFTY